MRKILILILILFLNGFISAQENKSSLYVGGPVNMDFRGYEFRCLPGTVFSQMHERWDSFYFADETVGFCNKVAENYTATGPFSKVRFWGGNFNQCEPGMSQQFLIEIFDGMPGSGGNPVHSFNVTVTPQPTGFFACNQFPTAVYMADADLGTSVDLLNGWIAISRVNPGDGCTFGILGVAGAEGNFHSYCADMWIENSGQLLLCMGTGNDPAAVPVSGWALVIGISLIIITLIIRYRKLA